jgi:hypothetical protein
MKTIFVLLAFALSLSSIAQNNLDTVYIRTLTMQAQDWAWLTGRYPNRADSTTLKAFRKIRTTVQSNIPASFTTSVTVDSLPGRVVIQFYQVVKTSPAGEIVNRYTAITNAISAKTVIAYWLGLIDGVASAEFTRCRDLGKNDLIDQ